MTSRRSARAVSVGGWLIGSVALMAISSGAAAQSPTVTAARAGPCPYSECALFMERRAFGARFFRGVGRAERSIGGTGSLIREVAAVPMAAESARRGQRQLMRGVLLRPAALGLGGGLLATGLITMLVPIVPRSQQLLLVGSGVVIGGGGLALSNRQLRDGHDSLGEAVYLYNKTLPR